MPLKLPRDRFSANFGEEFAFSLTLVFAELVSESVSLLVGVRNNLSMELFE